MTEKDLDIAIEKCERIMEFDTRTMQNPVSENGWIFEKVYELLNYLRQFQFATDTNVATTDTISRQAAIEAMRKAKDKSEAHRMLMQLPSAQPTGTNTVQVEDCISRQAAIEVADAVWTVTGDKNVAKVWQQLKDLPSAQPDVSDTNVGKICEYYDLCRNGRDEKKLREELLSAQPGWIPCSCELPKPNEEDGNGFYKAYLVQDGRWMDVARWDGKYWVAWGYSTVLLNVVAWMPLPTPYRKGGRNA